MAKQIKVREDNYFAVQGWMVTELKLKGNALMLYAIIYGFSQTTNTAFTGSVDYLCEWLGGVSRPTVINTLDNLVKQGLLTKSNATYNFSSKTAEAITQMVCDDMEIPVGSLAQTGLTQKLIVQNVSIYEIIMRAYTQAYQQNGVSYRVVAKKGYLNVEEMGKVVCSIEITEDSNITSSNYSGFCRIKVRRGSSLSLYLILRYRSNY